MTFLYYDPCFLEHETGSHPECAERLRRIAAHLKQRGLDEKCQRPSWQPATREQLNRIHGQRHIRAIEQFAKSGGGYIEADTVMSPRSYDVALMASGAVCHAVGQVVRGEDKRALCLVRPPGHHATPTHTMGFCLFNNIAIGAQLAISELGLDRVLIVDWDVHHGNGTQDAFWDDDHVAFLSIHRWPFYPGTGDADEAGQGRGLGWTKNLPITFGTPREEYFDTLRTALEEFADKARPQLVLLSAGFDSHRLDPIGSLGLETEDFGLLTDMVMEVAATHAQGRLVSVLEGGYNLDVLPDCVQVHLTRLLA